MRTAFVSVIAKQVKVRRSAASGFSWYRDFDRRRTACEGLSRCSLRASGVGYVPDNPRDAAGIGFPEDASVIVDARDPGARLIVCRVSCSVAAYTKQHPAALEQYQVITG
jgi:hypothetical protein